MKWIGQESPTQKCNRSKDFQYEATYKEIYLYICVKINKTVYYCLTGGITNLNKCEDVHTFSKQTKPKGVF